MVVLLNSISESVELWIRHITKNNNNNKPQPYIDPDLDPVLLIPGIAGSILKSVEVGTGKEERVWIRILRADYEFRTKLWSLFDPQSGKTVSLNPNTNIVVPEDRYGLYAIDSLDPDLVIGRDCCYYFHDMIVEMTKWGFEEGKTLFGFGYDFRQSNRYQETLDHLAAKLESVFNASGGKKINLISHSMGGLLVKCFMALHTDIFEKYVNNWIAIAAPFQGAPGYVMSTFLNGMSFVEGWEQNFFISKWSMHQLLIECPSIYELMANPDFDWEHTPFLEIWRENNKDGSSGTIIESYPPEESIQIYTEALSSNTVNLKTFASFTDQINDYISIFNVPEGSIIVNYNGVDIPLPFNLEILKWAKETRGILNRAKVPSQVKFYNIYGTGLETPHSVCYGSNNAPVTDLELLRFFEAGYICLDGDGTVPVESSKADGFNAEARVGVPGEHRGILCDHRVFRTLKTWLKAGDPDPFYNPLNDYVVLPTLFEVEKYREEGLEVTSLKEEWEIIGDDQNEEKPFISSISVCNQDNSDFTREEAHATVVVHPQIEGRQHVELNAVSVTTNA